MNKPLILIVEDDKAVKNLISTTLETHDYNYHVASTGESATLDNMQSTTNVEGSLFSNGDLKIDYISRCVYKNNEELHLTPIEYKLLCLLARNIGKVLTHTFITKEIWGSSWDSYVSSLRVYMATLRKKIETDTSHPQYIQTHVGVGYRIIKI